MFFQGGWGNGQQQQAIPSCWALGSGGDPQGGWGVCISREVWATGGALLQALCSSDTWDDCGSRWCLVMGPPHAYFWSPQWLWWFVAAPVALVGGILLPESLDAHQERSSYGSPTPLHPPLIVPNSGALILWWAQDSSCTLWCTTPWPTQAVSTQPTLVLSPELTSEAWIAAWSSHLGVSDCGAQCSGTSHLCSSLSTLPSFDQLLCFSPKLWGQHSLPDVLPIN